MAKIGVDELEKTQVALPGAAQDGSNPFCESGMHLAPLRLIEAEQILHLVDARDSNP